MHCRHAGRTTPTGATGTAERLEVLVPSADVPGSGHECDRARSGNDARGSGQVSNVGSVERLAAVAATGLLDTGAEESFDRLARLACDLLEVPFAFVTVVDDTRSFWKSCIGVDATALADRQNSVADSFCQHVINSDEPLIVTDARLNEVTGNNPSIEKMGGVAWAGHPLRSTDGQVVGTFCIVDVVPRAWSARQQETLRVLAAAVESEIRLRTMLENAAGSSVALRREVEVREHLAALATALTAASSSTAVAAAMTEHGPAVMEAQFVTVGVVDFERRQLRLHVPDDLLSSVKSKYVTLPLDAPTPLTDAVRTGEAVFLADRAAHHPRYDHLVADATKVSLSATAAVPLRRSDGTIIGALGVGWAQDRSFSRANTATLTTVALIAAQTLERAQLGDVRAHLVRSLQELLLPAVPDIDGLRAVVRYIPATFGLGFGGDWYDIIDLGDSRAAVVVGDIVGHGIEAAAKMARVRAAIIALTHIYRDDLVRVCAEAEGILVDLDDPYIATVAIFVVNTRSGHVEYVSAGHLPAILLHLDGTHELLAGGRRALLGQGGHPPEVGTSVLRPGSTLVAYTDGLIEDRLTPLDQGIDRLVEVSRSALAHADLDVAMKEIIETMLRGRDLTDDIALVLVERAPTA